MLAYSLVEPLEARIAPAVVIAMNGHSATYTDIDGDHVTVTVSKGTLATSNFTTVATGPGDQLEKLDLAASMFEGANVTFKVAKVAGGDGLVNVGAIDATGEDLGTVKLPGDLGRIAAGSGATGKTGLESLSVDSLGALGISTQAAGGSAESDIRGLLASVTVKHDIDQAFLSVNANIGTVTIGGSLIGGSAENSGQISAIGGITSVRIGGDLVGGSGMEAGGIDAVGSIKSISIGKSILGGLGTATSTGFVFVHGDLGSLTIGGDLNGSEATDSASITVGGKLGSLNVRGTLRGDVGTSSGSVLANAIGTVRIGHDLLGGPGGGSGSIVVSGSAPGTGGIASLAIGGSEIGNLGAKSGSILTSGDIGSIGILGELTGGPASDAGCIESGGTITSVTVGKSLTGSSSVSGQTISKTGAILATVAIKSVSIGGDIVGGSSANDSDLVDSGLVSASNTAKTSGTVGKVTVGGSILEGYDENTSHSTEQDGGGIFAGGDIGRVTVKHDIVGGFIGAEGNLAGASVGGSLEGQTIVDGTGYMMNGFIGAFGSVGPVKIGGSVIGGNADGTTMTETGCIAGGHLASVTIAGSLIAGTSVNGSTLSLSGAIPRRTKWARSRSEATSSATAPNQSRSSLAGKPCKGPPQIWRSRN